MKKIELWKICVFFGTLGFIAFIINSTQNHRMYEQLIESTQIHANVAPIPVPQSRQPPQSQPASQPSEFSIPAKPAPVVVRPLVWPSDMTPTRFIRIPNPEKPVSGVVDDYIHPGDDLSFEIDAGWKITFIDPPQSMETFFDFGEGFKSFAQTNEKYKESEETDPWWLKKRTMRMRLHGAGAEQGPFRFMIDKEVPEKPLPPVPPQTFGELSVIFRRLQGMNGEQNIIIDLDLKNMSDTHSIAVAFHSRGNPFDGMTPNDIHLEGSLLSSTGLEAFCEELTGLHQMNANPKYLTELGPKETRHVSLTYVRRQGSNPNQVTSYRLLIQMVVNGHYENGQYANYQPVLHVMPPGCKIESLVFEIPVRYSK